jgi:L-ascorbate metabolism protein UlaG (beta-lactamase superfamily)
MDFPAPNGKIVSITGTPARHGPAGGDRGPVTGFLLSYRDSRDEAIYVSGDTVWYEGVEETLTRFPNIHVAVLFLAARVPVLPANLTFSAAEAVRVAEALPRARIVPLHFEGWKHLTESKEDLSKAFAAAGREDQLLWLALGKAVPAVFKPS